MEPINITTAKEKINKVLKEYKTKEEIKETLYSATIILGDKPNSADLSLFEFGMYMGPELVLNCSSVFPEVDLKNVEQNNKIVNAFKEKIAEGFVEVIFELRKLQQKV